MLGMDEIELSVLAQLEAGDTKEASRELRKITAQVLAPLAGLTCCLGCAEPGVLMCCRCGSTIKMLSRAASMQHIAHVAWADSWCAGV